MPSDFPRLPVCLHPSPKLSLLQAAMQLTDWQRKGGGGGGGGGGQINSLYPISSTCRREWHRPPAGSSCSRAMHGLLGHVRGDSRGGGGEQVPYGDAGHQPGDLSTKPGRWPKLGSLS